MVSPRFVFASDAPPRTAGGHGCHVIAANIVRCLGERMSLLVTHQLNARTPLAFSEWGNPESFRVYRDASGWGLNRLSSTLRRIVDSALLRVQARGIADSARLVGPHRLLALSGADGFYLDGVARLARAMNLPLDLYLVDDFEGFEAAHGRRIAAALVRRIERRVLGGADRVFVISPGFAEHIRAKTGFRAEWLPIPVPFTAVAHTPWGPGPTGERALAFLGAINHLYDEALRTVHAAIQQWNASRPCSPIRLRLLAYHDPGPFLGTLPHPRFVEVHQAPPPDAFQSLLRSSWAMLLPYSQAREAELMTRTSFPTKFIDATTSGRPVIVFSHENSTLARHWSRHGLPLSVHRAQDLIGAFEAVAAHDGKALTDRYSRMIEADHGPSAFLAKLDAGGRT